MCILFLSGTLTVTPVGFISPWWRQEIPYLSVGSAWGTRTTFRAFLPRPYVSQHRKWYHFVFIASPFNLIYSLIYHLAFRSWWASLLLHTPNHCWCRTTRRLVYEIHTLSLAFLENMDAVGRQVDWFHFKYLRLLVQNTTDEHRPRFRSRSPNRKTHSPHRLR